MNNEHVSERLTAARERGAELQDLMFKARNELQGAISENDKIALIKQRASHIDARLCYAKIHYQFSLQDRWCPNKGKNDGLCGVHDNDWGRAARDKERQGKVVA